MQRKGNKRKRINFPAFHGPLMKEDRKLFERVPFPEWHKARAASFFKVLMFGRALEKCQRRAHLIEPKKFEVR